MVTTPSIASDHEAKRQRPTLEKSKVVTLSKQLQIRLQYARLKVEHGWQRQSLNEVENLYFHHSALKGKSKALRPSSSAPTTTGDSSPKATSRHTKDGRVVSESGQAAHPVSGTWTPGAVAASSSPTVAASPHDALPSPSSTPMKSPSPRTTKSTSTPSGTPAQAQASESARSVPLSSSVLSAFTQNFTTTQQLSREATMDFASLSPFVTASSFSSSSSSITAPSSFVSTVPPSPFASQPLAYQPSPFAPPPPSSAPVPPAPSLPMSQFTSPPFPATVQPSDMSASLETFPPNPQATFPLLVQTHPSSPSRTLTPAPAPAPTPASTPALLSPPASATVRSPAPARPHASKRIHSPAPAATPPSPQKPPLSASHSSASLSSFRPSKTFDIPTAPGPVTSTVSTGTQNTTMLTYDSFWSSHSSSAGGWRRAIVSNNNSSSSSSNSRSPAASASAVTSGITATSPSAAGGSLLEVRGSSAKA